MKVEFNLNSQTQPSLEVKMTKAKAKTKSANVGPEYRNELSSDAKDLADIIKAYNLDAVKPSIVEAIENLINLAYNLEHQVACHKAINDEIKSALDKATFVNFFVYEKENLK